MSEHNAFLIIPAYIANHPEVDASTALLFGRLNALSNKFGYCFAEDKYLAEIMNVCREEASRRISTLKKLDFIRVYSKRTQLGWDRRIYTCNNYKAIDFQEFKEWFKKVFTMCANDHIGSNPTITSEVRIESPPIYKEEKDNLKNSNRGKKNAAALPDALKNDRFALDLKDAQIPVDEIPDLIFRWQSLKSHLADKQNPFGFFISAYKGGYLDSVEEQSLKKDPKTVDPKEENFLKNIAAAKKFQESEKRLKMQIDEVFDDFSGVTIEYPQGGKLRLSSKMFLTQQPELFEKDLDHWSRWIKVHSKEIDDFLKK